MLKYPNFIVIGAHKSGTTALYYYLKQHPQIYMTPVKETNFFAWAGRGSNFSSQGPHQASAPKHWITTLDEYKEQFSGVRDEIVAGESCPTYLYSPDAHKGILQHCPNAKLIVVLRHPADRAFSHFLHRVRDNHESYSSLERVFGEVFNEGGETSAQKISLFSDYRGLGLYSEQLNRYFSCFSKHQIKIFLYDDLLHSPQSMFEDIFRFIGVDDSFCPDTSIKPNQSRLPLDSPIFNLFRDNVTSYLKKQHGSVRDVGEIMEFMLTYRPKIPSDLRSKLTHFYRDEILQLQDLIGRDLKNWM